MATLLLRCALAAHRRPAVVVLVLALLTGAAFVSARSLSVDPDMVDLLPPEFESVRGLEAVKKNFGGVGYVTVLASKAEPEDLVRFALDLVPKLEALPSVTGVDYRRPNDFFGDRALYYMDEADLQITLERLEARATWIKRKVNPLIVDLEDTEEPSLDFSDLEAKYKKAGRQTGVDELPAKSPYFLDEEGRMIALLVRPSVTASNLDFSQKVLAEIQQAVSELELKRYPGIEVQYTGRYAKKIAEKKVVLSDLSRATLFTIVAVLLYLLLHFRRVQSVLLLFIPLLAGLVWTYGLAAQIFDSLNVLSAFAGAILVGLGIDHGIHLLSRYEEQRRAGASQQDALAVSYGGTARAVVVAAFTTFVGFVALSFSDFRGFREFGWMTAAGTVLQVLGYLTLLPALLAFTDRKEVRSATKTAEKEHFAWTRWSASIFWIVTVAGFFTLLNASDIEFEYDFGRLQDSTSTAARLDIEVNRILGRSQTPIVLLTPTPADEHTVAEELRRRSNELGDKSGIDYVAGRSELVPADMASKAELLEEIADVLDDVDPDGLQGEDRKRHARLLKLSQMPPFAEKDLPPEVRRPFATKEGANYTGGLVLVFPSISLSDGKRIIDLAAEVRSIPLKDGGTVSAAGEAMVLADVLNLVFAETPQVVGWALLLVFLSLLLWIRDLRWALICFAPAPLTVLGALAVFGLLGERLNYLNLVVIPVLFGIAVDAGAHLVMGRPKTEAELGRLVSSVGRAVIGATLTTGFGFGALMFAHSPGLSSFGKLACVGLAINLMVAMAWLGPLLGVLIIRERRQTEVGLFDAFTGRWSADWGTVYGAGYSAKAPGTFGTLAAVPFGYLLSQLDFPIHAVIVVVLTLISFPMATRYMAGDAASEDPQEIVYDEFIGVLITFLFIPWQWPWVIAGFIMFRVFDIMKPGPVGWADRLHSPAGVMLDDIIAGLLAGPLLFGVRALGISQGWWT